MEEITLIEVVNGITIHRKVSKRTYEMMSDRTKERFNIATKAEPKRIAIPAETIALMEQNPIIETIEETQTPEDNGYPKQKVAEKLPSNAKSVGAAKKTRKRRSV